MMTLNYNNRDRRCSSPLTGRTSFLLIVCWMMVIHLIRPTDGTPIGINSAENEFPSESNDVSRAAAATELRATADREEYPQIDAFLNTVQDLLGPFDDMSASSARHPQLESRGNDEEWDQQQQRGFSPPTKREETLLSSASNRLQSHANRPSRSALNKNFIRFGKRGYMRRATSNGFLPRALLEKGYYWDNEEPVQSFSHFPRSLRGLQSNFIRFGRSVLPSSNSETA